MKFQKKFLLSAVILATLTALAPAQAMFANDDHDAPSPRTAGAHAAIDTYFAQFTRPDSATQRRFLRDTNKKLGLRAVEIPADFSEKNNPVAQARAFTTFKQNILDVVHGLRGDAVVQFIEDANGVYQKLQGVGTVGFPPITYVHDSDADYDAPQAAPPSDAELEAKWITERQDMIKTGLKERDIDSLKPLFFRIQRAPKDSAASQDAMLEVVSALTGIVKSYTAEEAWPIVSEMWKEELTHEGFAYVNQTPEEKVQSTQMMTGLADAMDALKQKAPMNSALRTNFRDAAAKFRRIANPVVTTTSSVSSSRSRETQITLSPATEELFATEREKIRWHFNASDVVTLEPLLRQAFSDMDSQLISPALAFAPFENQLQDILRTYSAEDAWPIISDVYKIMLNGTNVLPPEEQPLLERTIRTLKKLQKKATSASLSIEYRTALDKLRARRTPAAAAAPSSSFSSLSLSNNYNQSGPSRFSSTTWDEPSCAHADSSSMTRSNSSASWQSTSAAPAVSSSAWDSHPSSSMARNPAPETEPSVAPHIKAATEELFSSAARQDWNALCTQAGKITDAKDPALQQAAIKALEDILPSAPGHPTLWRQIIRDSIKTLRTMMEINLDRARKGW